METLKADLRHLGEVFDDDAQASAFKASFDEYVRECEFELALHAICDFLLLERPGLITSERIEVVKKLPDQMHIQDECLREMHALSAR